MISDFFTKSFQRKRQVWVNNESGPTDILNFKGYKQSVSMKDRRDNNIPLDCTNPYVYWCPLGTDIKESDVVDGEIVMFVIVRDYGENSHLQFYTKGYEKN